MLASDGGWWSEALLAAGPSRGMRDPPARLSEYSDLWVASDGADLWVASDGGRLGWRPPAATTDARQCAVISPSVTPPLSVADQLAAAMARSS